MAYKENLPKCPTGLEVQSILIPKKHFDNFKAKAWLKANGFSKEKIDETDTYFRFRQTSPSKYREGSFRTGKVGEKGIKFIYGCPLNRMAGGGAVSETIIDELWKGYASAILFAESDSDTDESLDASYSIEDFDDETVSSSKKILTKFYQDNEDAIKKSSLELFTVGSDVWYTRAGHGAGFFDHSLDKDVEKQLIDGAKALGEYPTVETYDGKISVRGGRVFKYEGGGRILKEISTHKAVVNGDKIDIIIKGFEVEDLKRDDEYLYSIPISNEDDLFNIFERYKEDNRINVAEANEEFGKKPVNDKLGYIKGFAYQYIGGSPKVDEFMKADMVAEFDEISENEIAFIPLGDHPKRGTFTFEKKYFVKRPDLKSWSDVYGFEMKDGGGVERFNIGDEVYVYTVKIGGVETKKGRIKSIGEMTARVIVDGKESGYMLSNISKEKKTFKNLDSELGKSYAGGGGVGYGEIKKEKEKMTSELFEKCGVFFAFSDEQFNKNKTPLKEGEKYVSIGAGGYMPKGNLQLFEDGMKAINQYGKKKVEENNLAETEILYELRNHESFYTDDYSDVVEMFAGTYTEQQISDVYNKHREANQSFKKGGSTLSGEVGQEQINFNNTNQPNLFNEGGNISEANQSPEGDSIDLSSFTGTDHYYRYNLFGKEVMLTDGVKYLAEKANAYWFINAILSHQIYKKVSGEGFQTWTLTKNESNDSAILVADDGNGNIIAEQEIEYTDFPLPKATVWLVDNVLLLPSEY